MKRAGLTGPLLVILLLLAAAGGINYWLHPFKDRSPTNQLTAQPEPTPEPAEIAKVRAAYAQLKPAEKIAQLVALPVTIESASSSATVIKPAILSVISQLQPGFVTWFGSQISSQSALAAQQAVRLQAKRDLPAVIMVDHEGGSVQRLAGAGFTKLPAWQSVCQLDEATQNALLEESASQLAAVGVQIVLGPSVDVATRSSVLKTRVCSGDPNVVTAAARRAITAYRDAGIIAVLKHYPGLGTAVVDPHQEFGLVASNVPDFFPYKQLLAEFPLSGVMVSPMGILNQFYSPCMTVKECIDVLNQKYHRSIVFSDGLEMKAAVYDEANPEVPRPIADVARDSLVAGTDVLVFGQDADLSTAQAVVASLSARYDSDRGLQLAVERSINKLVEYRALFWPSLPALINPE